jgi:flagella basal body P-ring formation protein FlgA
MAFWSGSARTNYVLPAPYLSGLEPGLWIESLPVLPRPVLYQMNTPVLVSRLALAAGLAAVPAWADTQDPAQVQGAVEAFVRTQTASLPGRVEVSVGAVDPRLKLARCESLDAFLPPGVRLWGNATVGVRCASPKKWSLFVPVQVQVWANVVVSARALTRGQTLITADLASQSLDLAQLPQGVFTDSNPLLGKVVTTSVAGGTPLRHDMLRAPPVVLQGQTVRVVFTGEGLSVSSEGRAQGNAGVGEAVQVRMASGKLIKGIVLAPGTVEVR